MIALRSEFSKQSEQEIDEALENGDELSADSTSTQKRDLHTDFFRESNPDAVMLREQEEERRKKEEAFEECMETAAETPGIEAIGGFSLIGWLDNTFSDTPALASSGSSADPLQPTQP